MRHFGGCMYLVELVFLFPKELSVNHLRGKKKPCLYNFHFANFPDPASKSQLRLTAKAYHGIYKTIRTFTPSRRDLIYCDLCL